MFGCVRVAWNDALNFCKSSEKFPGFKALSAMLTQSKKNDERQWLKDVSSVPLQQALRQLDTAYRNFFNSRNGKRKGGKMGSPRFKKKTNSQSAEFTKAAFSMGSGTVYLAKIGDLKPVWSRDLPSEPSSVTVTTQLRRTKGGDRTRAAQRERAELDVPACEGKRDRSGYERTSAPHSESGSTRRFSA